MGKPASYFSSLRCWIYSCWVSNLLTQAVIIKKICKSIGYDDSEFIAFKNHILHTLFKETRSDDVMRQFLNKKPKNLSGGQKQRLIIALVIVRKPDLIIGDEIGTGIDLKIKKDIYNLLLDFRRGKNMGIGSPL